MTTHARLSPSGASRWMRCPGSVLLCEKEPDTESSYSIEGTGAHELAEKCLNAAIDPSNYLGENVNGVVVSNDMAHYVRSYMDVVHATKGELFVECRLPLEPITGEVNAFGTADAVVIKPPRLSIIDLKYGMGVKVDALDNEQLMIYALAALDEFSAFGDIDEVELTIVQPRLDHVSTVLMPVAELKAFYERVKTAVAKANQCTETSLFLTPGPKQCRFCKAKATCPAIAASLTAAMSGNELDLTKPFRPQLSDVMERVSALSPVALGECMDVVDLAEGWCKAIRARTELELINGNHVPGYKLVEGRKGARKWIDETRVIDVAAQANIDLDEVSARVVHSPAALEKTHKNTELWSRLQPLIEQSPGKPSVAHVSDKRPALKTAFELLTGE